MTSPKKRTSAECQKFAGTEMNQHSGETLASKIEIPTQKQGRTQNNHSRCRRQCAYMQHNTIVGEPVSRRQKRIHATQHNHRRGTTQSRRRATIHATTPSYKIRRRSEVRSYRSTRARVFTYICVSTNGGFASF